MGQAFSLHGAGAIVEFPDAPQFSMDKTMSIEGWISARELPAQATIASQYDTSQSQASWVFGFRDAGRLEILLYSGDLCCLDGVRSTSPVISTGEWMHVAATVDLSSVPSTMRLYTNGAEAQTEVWRSGDSITSSSRAHLRFESERIKLPGEAHWDSLWAR